MKSKKLLSDIAIADIVTLLEQNGIKLKGDVLTKLSDIIKSYGIDERDIGYKDGINEQRKSK